MHLVVSCSLSSLKSGTRYIMRPDELGQTFVVRLVTCLVVRPVLKTGARYSMRPDDLGQTFVVRLVMRRVVRLV